MKMKESCSMQKDEEAHPSASGVKKQTPLLPGSLAPLNSIQDPNPGTEAPTVKMSLLTSLSLI